MKKTHVLWLAFSLASLAPAANTAMVFRLGEAQELRRGRFENTTLRENGALSLTPGCARIEDIPSTVVWSILETSNAIWVGTGHKGELRCYPGKSSNSVSVLLQAREVLSLSEGPDGSVYAGTAPKGVVYRIARDGGAVEIVTILNEGYVWDLACEGRNLWAATGNPGKLYRISLSDRRSELVYTSTEENILKVRLRGGIPYVSTSGRGYLVRIDGQKTNVLYDAGERDINDFLVGDDLIHLATSGKKMISEPGSGPSAQSEPRSFYQNEVVELNARGRPRTLFSVRNQTIPSLARQVDGHLLIGTGNEGEIHSLDPKNGRSHLLYKIPGASIVAFSRTPGVNHFITGGDTGLYRMELAWARRGTYTTDILDTRGASAWGRVHYGLIGPSNGVKVAARTGNSYSAGQGWTDWLAADAQGRVTNEPARFIQVRIELKSISNIPPELSDLRIYYGAETRSPALVSFQIGRNSEVEKSNKLNLDANDLLLWWDSGETRPEGLEYRLAYRNLLADDWREMDLKLRGKHQVIKKTSIPDGEWQFRLSAHDRFAASGNPADSMTSRRVAVDNTPPEVVDARLRGRVLSFRVVDGRSPVQRVEWSALLDEFKPLAPMDGLLDSRDESFNLTVPEKAPFVILHVFDDQGNDAFVTLPTENLPSR
jgi:hypothetical protein